MLATIERSDVTSRRTASANQIRYIKAELSGIGSYMIAMGHRVDGSVNVERLRAAFAEVVSRHACLRTRFMIEGGVIWASADDAPAFRFHQTELGSDDFETFRAFALPHVFAQVEPWHPGALVRLVVAQMPGCWRFCIAMHHAVSDGITRNLIDCELLETYRGAKLPAAASYFDYEESNASDLGATCAHDVRDFVSDLPIGRRIPNDGLSQTGHDGQGVFVERTFDCTPTQLRDLAKQCGATKFGVLGALYALTLAGLTGETQLTSFFQSAGRRSKQAPPSVAGPFSNTLPLDLSFDQNAPFDQLAGAISKRVRAVLELEDTNLLDAVIAAGKAPTISLNMFPTAAEIEIEGLQVSPREFLDRRTEYDLNLVWTEDGDRLCARAFYAQHQLSQERAGLILDLVGYLLGLALSDPQRTGTELFAAVGERASPQHKAMPVPKREGAIHQAFFAWAERQPQACALVTSSSRLSYGELQTEALRYTASLQALGVLPGQPVAILADRGPGMIAAILGVLAAGASFAVIDAGYPAARIQKLLEGLDVDLLIVATKAARYDRQLADRYRIVAQNREASSPQAAAIKRTIAYHLFTSGTTGEPKKVSHPDTTLLRFLDWQTAQLSQAGDFRFCTAMIAGLSHDPIMRDIFLPLSTGGTLTIPSVEELRTPEALRDLLQASGTNILHLTPATGRLIGFGAPSDLCLDGLRAVFWGGDTLDGETVGDWRSLAPAARQFNLYGTTETPQAVLAHEITDDERGDWRIPMGKPVPWMNVQLVMPFGAHAVPGALGEIVVELPDPVIGAEAGDDVVSRELPTSRHQTGDLAFFRPSLGFVFAGRRDNQVKRNAVRIDLDEIAATARTLAVVRQAAAIIRGDHKQQLVLFVAGPERADVKKIEAGLRHMLPCTMIPDRIICVDDLPISANGKIDKRALQSIEDLEPPAQRAERQDTTPVSPLEKRLAQVYSELSGQTLTSRHQSLTDLGADSLSMIEARILLEGDLGVLPDGWERMSIRDLAATRQLTAPQPAKADAKAKSRWLDGLAEFTRMECFVFLRTLAIVYIVARHAGALGSHAFGGGAHMLMALAGYAFAKLQLPAILADGRTGRVFALLAKLLIPLVPASLLIFAVHLSVGNEPHISALMLYENLSPFIEAVVFDRVDTHHHIEWLWFLHAYLQLFAIIGLVVVVRPLRQWAAADPWRAVGGFFIAAEAIAIVSVIMIAAASGESVQDTGKLLQRSPTSLLPLLMLGALFAYADTSNRKIWAALAAAVHFAAAVLVPLGGEDGLWLIALLMLILVSHVSIPAVITGIVLAISAHALMIYLSHRAIGFAWTNLVTTALPPWGMVAIELAAGVAFGLAMQPVFERLRLRKLAQRRIST